MGRRTERARHRAFTAAGAYSLAFVSMPEPATHVPEILARGPWPLEQIHARWREDYFQPPDAYTQAADAAIQSLKDRGSPSHDGVAARMVNYREQNGSIEIELQPLRWALRLVAEDASSERCRAVRHALRRRTLAGRTARAVGVLVGRALGAGRRRRGRPGREPS